MASSDQIWFRSARFKVEPGEDAATNPGVYGKKLAGWLADELSKKGEAVSEIFPEDWGWCIGLEGKKNGFVGCANAWDKTDEWGVFVNIDEGLLELFGRRRPQGEVDRLQSVMIEILTTSDGISDIRLEKMQSS